MAHLKTEHIELDKLYYPANNAMIKASVTGKTTVKELVAQIEDNMEVVFIQVPYTGWHVFLIVVNIFNGTRFYIEEAEKWDAKITADKGWVNFKLHYSPALRQIRNICLSANQSQCGMAEANMATDNPESLNEMQQDTQII